MNLVEHYIKKLEKVEEYPFEEEVKVVTDNGVETKHYEFKEAVIAFMKINCYGVEQDVEKIYKNKEELQKDLDRGYYMG